MAVEGADGCRSYTRDEVIRVPGRQVRVVDTIGAGDAFCAALLDGLERADCLGAAQREVLGGAGQGLWHDVLDRANAAAAASVSRSGASPVTRAELDALREPVVAL